jgi:hypothetical protein
MNAHDDRHDPIRQRAYELFEARGRDEGRDLDDWLQAERELQNQPDSSATSRPNQKQDERAIPERRT